MLLVTPCHPSRIQLNQQGCNCTDISDHMPNTQPKSVEEVIDRAMIRVTIAVGKELLD